MNKEDFRVTRTRTSINIAFLKILDDKAFQKITVKEITVKAQCNRNTFYLHYIDKYDLMDKLCDINLKSLNQTLYETYKKLYSSKKDWYFDIAKRCLDTIELNILFYKVVLGKNRYPSFADKFRELLIKFISANFDKIEKKKKRLEVVFCANGMVGIIRYWLNNKEEYSKETILEALNNLIVRLGSIIFE